MVDPAPPGIPGYRSNNPYATNSSINTLPLGNGQSGDNAGPSGQPETMQLVQPLDQQMTEDVRVVEAQQPSATGSLDHKALEEQIKALQNELEFSKESNFDLQATMATLKAELDVAVHEVETKRKDETSKLQHSLRLEQQKTQRLIQQQRENSKDTKKQKLIHRPGDSFSIRLPTVASVEGRNQNVSSPVDRAMLDSSPLPDADQEVAEAPVPLEISMTPPVGAAAVPPAMPNAGQPVGPTGAVWLAQQILHLGSREETEVREVLISVASQASPNNTEPQGKIWAEEQLVEYLLQEGTAEHWQAAFLVSRVARKGLVKAMQNVEREEVNEDMEDVAHATANTTLNTKPSNCRIRRLGQTSNNLSDEDAVGAVRRAVSNSWWVPNRDTATTIHSYPSHCTMDSDQVREWVENRLDPNNPLHLQTLTMILAECPDQSTSIWWTFLVPGITLVLQHIHWYKVLKYEGSRGTLQESTATSLVSPKRQLRFTGSSTFSTHSSSDSTFPEGRVDELFTTCLAIMDRLVSITRPDHNQEWYSKSCIGTAVNEDSEEAPRQEEEDSAKLWIGLVLDIVEGVDLDDKEQPISLPPWYQPAIRFLTSIGTTPQGVTALRTRLSNEIGVREWMGNAFDVATMQLFELCLMDEPVDDPLKNQTYKIGKQRAAIDGWVRLWHQALLFVHSQQQQQQQRKELAKGKPDQEGGPATDTTAEISSAISFRSLVLDYQDYYTGAYARLLSSEKLRPEIQSMIQLQLEELSMDEEEHEEMKQ